MTMRDYESATKLMEKYTRLSDFVGPRPLSLIEAAEGTLGLTFPPTYRRFLTEYGAGSFGASEIYGVIDENFKHSSIPDAVWYTLSLRSEIDLPNDFVVIYNTGGEEVLCLNFESVDNEQEARIVVFYPGVPLQSQPMEVVAQDFGELLLSFVQSELSNET